MTETLAGTIDQMSLLEILKLIHSGKMNGRLSITNSYGKGELYVKEGQIIHCETGTSIGETALTTMLCWIEGKFRFETDLEPPEETITTTTEQLLLESARKIQDWQNVKKVVTSMEDVFALARGTAKEQVNLAGEEWQILSYINGQRTVGEIMEETSEDEYKVAKVIFKLHSIGLLDKVDQPKTTTATVINETFFENIEQELIEIIGPMAPIVIDEAIEDLGGTRAAFPNNKIAALIEKVSEDIREEHQKLKFTQIMLESFQNL